MRRDLGNILFFRNRIFFSFSKFISKPSFNDCVTGSNISNTEICVTIVCSLAQFLSEIHCERVNFIQWNMLQRNN